MKKKKRNVSLGGKMIALLWHKMSREMDFFFLRRVAGSWTKSEDPGEESDFRLGFKNFFGDLAFDIMRVSLFTLDKNKH